VPDPDGRVKLPRKLQAEVPGASRIRYFGVSGRSASALVRQTLRRAAPHCGVHNALACVDLTWHVETTQRTEDGACTVVDATSAVSSVVHLPRWTKPVRVDAELLTWWRKVLTDSARHEARHIKILQAELAQLRKRLVGRPCASIDRLIDRARQRADKSQAAFDRRESAKPLPPAP
jgi:predicted secreted Zn-dependent protease